MNERITNRVFKNPNYPHANQLAVYKAHPGVEYRETKNKSRE